MHDVQLQTALCVDLVTTRCQKEGLFVTFINKGAPYTGTILLKLNGQGNGFRLLTQVRDIDGALGWMHALDEEEVEENQIDAYIRRALDRDPDIWVIEIEDKTLTNPFEGKLIE